MSMMTLQTVEDAYQMALKAEENMSLKARSKRPR
jgi:hypothetical protein